MRAVYRAAIVGALAVLALVAAAVLPERYAPDAPPAETPEIVYVEVTPEPNVVIIPAPEGFDGDLDNLWVAITVEGMDAACWEN